MNNKPKKISSLTVLKFVAMLLIVWWHIGKPSGKIDLGARACEFLFVVSGFLVGYNYFHKGMPDKISFCFKYTFNKLKKFWPLHFFCLLAYMILNFRTCILGFNLQQIPTLLANIFLLQAWSPDVGGVAFSYNGVSWFLSALIFCYFISPWLITFIKKKKVAIPLFIFIALLRVYIDFCCANSCNIFKFSIHTSPIVRALEYFMGMLMVPVFFWIKEKIPQKRFVTVIATILEVGLLIALYFVMRNFNSVWNRSNFVLIFCAIVFFFAFDLGYFSVLCSNKYVLQIANIQLEVYLLQFIVNGYFVKFLNICNFTVNFWTRFLLSMTILFIVSIIYKLVFENRIAKFFDKTYNKLHKQTDPEIPNKSTQV